jgi:ATP-dependent Clp protease adaptor protein ClpS
VNAFGERSEQFPQKEDFIHAPSKKNARFLTLSHMKRQTDIQESEYADVLEEVLEPFHLIVWNDEVNTFEWVIETLMEICNHSYEQAEQCAYIIHYKGKYAVKQGDYEELKPMCDAITDRGIGATLETVLA